MRSSSWAICSRSGSGDDAAARARLRRRLRRGAAGGRRRACRLLHARQPRLPGRRRFPASLRARRCWPTRPCWASRGQRWLLTHGDALCLADTDYLRFRAAGAHAVVAAGVSRPSRWQQRQAIARDLRGQSEDAQAPRASQYADVDSAAAARGCDAADAQVLIHGHTHRPADHALGERPAHRAERLGRGGHAATPAGAAPDAPPACSASRSALMFGWLRKRRHASGRFPTASGATCWPAIPFLADRARTAELRAAEGSWPRNSSAPRNSMAPTAS